MGQESEKRCDLRQQQKMEREEASSDVRWKTFTEEQLQQKMLFRRQWTNEFVEHPDRMRQNVVVILLERLLVDVVRHISKLAPDHI